MALGGVRTTRVHLAWNSIEPSPGARNWAAFDAQVANAARAGMRLLPFLYESPRWISPTVQAPPIYSLQARAAWTSFLTDLAGRYGTNGSFWALHPELGIRIPSARSSASSSRSSEETSLVSTSTPWCQPPWVSASITDL